MNKKVAWGKFLRTEKTNDRIIIKIERKNKGTKLKIRKQDLIWKKIIKNYKQLVQNPHPYGFANFHKKHATASFIVYSCKFLPQYKLFSDSTLRKERVPGAEIEASSLLARKKLEILEFESNEQNVSIDVKSTYTNFPLSQVIETTLRCLFSIETTPYIGKTTHEFPLKRAVTNVYF